MRLVGGRYDGMTFAATDGWSPGPEVGVLYLPRAASPGSLRDVQRKILQELQNGPVATSEVEVPFAAREKHDPFDKRWHGSEVYIRCPDGNYRVPSLARSP